MTIIKINAVKNLSGYEFNAMKFGNPIRENKVSRFYVYVGRAWSNRHGRSLKASPLANLQKRDKTLSDEKLLERYSIYLNGNIRMAVDIINCNDSDFTAYKNLDITTLKRCYDIFMEIVRILSLCSQYNEVILVCHCVKSELDDQTPCHARIIQKVIEERLCK